MSIEHAGEQLLPTIAYGDAAGLPVEIRSADYIETNYGTINRLLTPTENPFYRGMSAGMWSDDTQLSLATAHGLINADGFNLDCLAGQHIAAYLETPNKINKEVIVKSGWGKSTQYSVERLIGGISPEKSGEIGGEGNGILMKMAPLVFWQVARATTDDERYQQYDQFTTMTHDSDITRACTRVHGDVLHYLLTNIYDKRDFLEVIDQSLSRHEYEMSTPGVLRDLLGYLHGDVNKDTILRHTDGKGFYVTQTLAMAYGSFVAHPDNFEEAVYEAVNLGGDTDSIASIVAAMSNFSQREKLVLPADYEIIDQLSMLQTVSRELAERALGLIEAS